MAASVVVCGSRAGSALIALEIPAVFAVAFLSRQFRNRQVAIAGAVIAVVAGFCIAVAGWETLAGKLSDPDPFLHRREMLHSRARHGSRAAVDGSSDLGTFPTVLSRLRAL